MPANVETMFSVNKTPWHGLGHVLESAPTTAEGIRLAGLDWSAVPRPLLVQGNRENRPVGSHRAIVRSDNGAILGVVGSKYQPLQNVDAFRFFDPFIAAGCELETAGALGAGETVWVLATLPKGESEIRPGDSVRSYVLLSNSHDGSSTVRAGLTSVRVVCANTLAIAHSTSNLRKVRHTRGMHAKLADARTQIKTWLDSARETADAYRRLAATPITDRQFDDYAREVFRVKPAKTEPAPVAGIPVDEVMGISLDRALGKQRASRVIAQARECYERAPGQREIQGTAWGAYNAVTAYLTHVRGRSADNRLRSNMAGQSAVDNSRALSLALNMAN